MLKNSTQKLPTYPPGVGPKPRSPSAREVGDYARNASRMASKQFDRAQDVAIDAYDETEAAIRRNPLTAVAIALGIGFLLGVVLVRR